MAMEIVKVIEEAHESTITSIAFNKIRKEIYSSADGDKVIKVSDVKKTMLSGRAHVLNITLQSYSTILKRHSRLVC